MINVKERDDISTLFKRYDGWSGSDGIYVIKHQNMLNYYFSDTLIGKANKDGIRYNFDLINNSLGLSSLDIKDIKFIYNEKPLSSIFVSNNDKNYYWLEASIKIDNKLFIYALKMENNIFSNELFKARGIDIIEIELPFKLNPKDNKYIIHHLYDLNNNNNKSLVEKNIVLGNMMIKKDDYYYIYGYTNNNYNKKLILTRTKDILSYQNYEYLDINNNFINSKLIKLSNIKILKEFFTTECNIHLYQNEYYVAYSKGSVNKSIYMFKLNDLINGDYQKELIIYTSNLVKDDLIAYNSKIQNDLCIDDKFIISYNVNTLINENHKYLDIYYPRFIELDIKEFNRIYEKL